MSDKITACEYKYKVDLTYLNLSNNVSRKIDTELVKNIVIDHNYNVNNMPIIYVSLALDKDLIDDMIINEKNAVIIFGLYKYDIIPDNALEIECFKKKFTYFLPKKLNPNNDIDYNEINEEETLESTHVQVSLGLMCVDHINDNKKSFNNTIKNTTMYDYVKYITSHIKNLIIEPFNYNEKFNQLIVPITNSVSSTLSYLNDFRVFYNSPYRYYLDFNYAYIISSNGYAITRNDELIDTIIIDIRDIFDEDAYDPGMVVNNTKSFYKIPVSYQNANVYDNQIISKSKTVLEGYTSTDTIQKTLSKQDLYGTEKIDSIRMNNENIHMIDNIHFQYELDNVFISVVKTGLDTDVFSINKRYMINNINRYKEHNGTYILTRKREVYMREDTENFILSTVLNFNKVPEL